MTTRTWIGGGNNQASNPKDWSPSGVPQAGDTLDGGVDFGSGLSPTININGNDLAGDRIFFQGVTSLTANLKNHALVNALVMFGSGNSTFNVSQQSTLDAVFSRAPATVNLSQNSTVDIFNVDRTNITVHISGHDTALLGLSGLGGMTVNLDPGASWTGTVGSADTQVGTILSVNGGAGAAFNNDGNSVVGTATINAAVLGTGSMDALSGKLEFVRSVGRNQSVSDASLVQIDQPGQFAASISLASYPSGNAPPAIDLKGLATADSYTFKNDMLRIYAGKSVIDTLRLTDKTQFGFAVEKTVGSVNIVGIDPTHPATGTVLPIHL